MATGPGGLSMAEPFTLFITASDDNIDELGHVNNAVWVKWIQDVATAHWMAVADPFHVDAYVWVVTRHEIDNRGDVNAGERRSEEHTSELQSLMRISYAVFCLKKTKDKRGKKTHS